MAIHQGCVRGFIEPITQEEYDPDASKRNGKCAMCGKRLTGKQEKFCCDQHRIDYHNGKRPKKWHYFNG